MAYIILFACASVCPIFFWKFTARENEAGENLINDWRARQYGKVLVDAIIVALLSGVLTFFVGGLAVIVGGGLGQMILEASSGAEQQRFAFANQIVGGFLWVLTAVIMIVQAVAKSESESTTGGCILGNRNESPRELDPGLINEAQLIFHPVDRILNDAHFKAAQAYIDAFGETHPASYARLVAALQLNEIQHGDPYGPTRDSNRQKVVADFVDSISQGMSSERASTILRKLVQADGYGLLEEDLFLDIFANAFGIYRLNAFASKRLRIKWDELSRLDAHGRFVHSATAHTQLKKEFEEYVRSAAPSVRWRFDDFHGLIVFGSE